MVKQCSLESVLGSMMPSFIGEPEQPAACSCRRALAHLIHAGAAC